MPKDTSAPSRSAARIVPTPPPGEEATATAYGPGGTFDVEIDVAALINADVDCRRLRCAIVTRNDHTRTADRSQDILIPVSFSTDPALQPTSLPPPAPVESSPEVAPEEPIEPSPPLSTEATANTDVAEAGNSSLLAPVIVLGSLVVVALAWIIFRSGRRKASNGL
ncbi:MAG: hypothetical protein ACT4OM_10835 [Actinomycetota bacterium]